MVTVSVLLTPVVTARGGDVAYVLPKWVRSLSSRFTYRRLRGLRRSRELCRLRAGLAQGRSAQEPGDLEQDQEPIRAIVRMLLRSGPVRVPPGRTGVRAARWQPA